MRMIKIFMSVFLAAFLVACGGSGGDDPVNEKTNLSAENVTKYALAGSEAVNQNLAIFNNPESPKSLALKHKIQNKTSGSGAGSCPSGGSYSYDFTSSSVDSFSFNYVYDNCAYDGEIFNGSFLYELTPETLVITYNYSYTFNGYTTTANGTETCVNDNSIYTCSFLSDDFIVNDTTYSYESTSDITGDPFGGYNFSVRVSSSDEEDFSIVASGVKLCDDGSGYIQSGTITITDLSTNESAVITFIDCNSFSIEFDGSVTTYNYSDL